MANKNAAKATAVARLVEMSKMDRAGQNTSSYYRGTVQPAVTAATAVGCNLTEIHAEADRTYGQWLIDNAGR
jgi:protein subunit release factor B